MKFHKITLIELLVLLVATVSIANRLDDLTECKQSAPKRRVKRIVGGQPAKPPPPDDPVVFAHVYKRDARVEGFRHAHTKIYHFLSLYYAEAPIADKRYNRPIYKRLQGDLNATRFGPPCIQPDPNYPNRVVGSEDCLLLNVYTPQMPDESTGLPVYVWLHPGGFRFGSAAQYDATPIAQQGVIVVVPQYRLGSLGIMGVGTKEFDGNLAIFDMALALFWVNDYIQYFGGDPKQVHVIGHGSGAASAMYLSMSRTTRQAVDVKGVVAMSGTALSQYATDKEPVQSVEEIARINGCPTTNELTIVKCLREKTAEEIIQNDSQIQTERLAGRAMIQGISGSVTFEPHVEEEDDYRGLPGIVVGEPEQQLRNAEFEPIPLLTGVTKDETANAFTIDTVNRVFGSAEKFLASVTDALNELTSFLRIDKLTGQIMPPVLPGLTTALTPTLNDLLKVPDTLNVNEVLAKITETTTDVLFNLPAVLTTQLWSQIAPAFIYSFEYKGGISKGINFLRGLPIVSEQQGVNNTEIVAHGDELGYMFDANDIFGNPLLETRLTTNADLKVRKNLIGMLKQFVKNTANGKKASAPNNGLFRSVSGKGTPFIKIDSELLAGNDLRFCELSLMGASLTPLTSTTCKSLEGLLNPLTSVLGSVGGTLDGGTGSLLGGTLGGVGVGGSGDTNSGGLLGGTGGLLGLGGAPKATTSTTTAPLGIRRRPAAAANTTPRISGLGLLGGGGLFG